jgi:hypothetical protein
VEETFGFGRSDGQRCFAIGSLSDPTVGDTWHSGCLGEQGGYRGGHLGGGFTAVFVDGRGSWS